MPVLPCWLRRAGVLRLTDRQSCWPASACETARRQYGFISTPTPERRFGVGPRAGERFTVDVPTHAAAALQLESGVLATVTVSLSFVRW